MWSNVAHHVQELAAGLVSLAFPPHCALCRTPGDEPLCPACRSALPSGGRPVTTLIQGEGSRPAAVTWARAAGRYEGAARRCVLRLKYDARLGLVAPMAQRMLAAAGAPPAFSADAVLAIPLHAARSRERTFNQAAALADAVAHGLGRPVLRGVLVRRRPTPPQSSLDLRQRRRNVAGAFAVRRPEAVRGRRLLLVDDVATTGATAGACGRALRAAGAAEVGLLTFAHG